MDKLDEKSQGTRACHGTSDVVNYLFINKYKFWFHGRPWFSGNFCKFSRKVIIHVRPSSDYFMRRFDYFRCFGVVDMGE